MNVLIPRINYSTNFNVSDEQETIRDYPTSSKDNEYVPIHSLGNGLRYGTTVEDSYLMYQLEFPVFQTFYAENYLNFSKKIGEDNYHWHQLRHTSVPKGTYYSKYGTVLFIENNKMYPLLMLCAKKEYLFKLDRGKLDPNHFSLLIDRSFIKDEQHYKVYRNVKQHYLDQIEDVDVVYTNSIIDRCFNTKSVALPTYQTMPELIRHLDETNSLVLNGLTNE